MTMTERQPSPNQARFMAKVFIIATLLGMLVVFLNVTMRSYDLRMQRAQLKPGETPAELSVPHDKSAPEAMQAQPAP